MHHTPLIKKLDLNKFISTHGSSVSYYTSWCNYRSEANFAYSYTEDGPCMVLNPLNANVFFRNDTVDPSFLSDYMNVNYGTDPFFWDIETGYTRNILETYPLRSFDKGKNNGFKVFVTVGKKNLKGGMNQDCREDVQTISIGLHHPAEVSFNSDFVKVQFNKSITLLVKPKITTTSENLRAYDPSVLDHF